MYFRFCGSRHVFTQLGLTVHGHVHFYAARAERSKQLIDFNQILPNAKDRKVHIEDGAPGAKSAIYDCALDQ